MATIATHATGIQLFISHNRLEPQRKSKNDLHPQSRTLGRQPQTELSAREEERLLAASFAHHANLSAMDKLLDELELLDESRRVAARRPLPLGDPMRNQRVEELLMDAVVRTHPQHDCAISRMLGDVCGDAALDTADESREQSQFETSIDNDYDGMS